NEFIFDPGSSHVTIGDPVNENFLITDMPAMSFWELTLDFHDIPNQEVSGTSFTHNKLEVLKGSRIVFDAFSTHSVNDTLSIIGSCIDSIYLSSNGALPASINALGTTFVQAECIGFNGVAAGGVPLTADYSSDLGGTNTNWTINSAPPVSANFTADGPFCYNDTTEFTDLSVPQAGVTGFTSYWYFDDTSLVYTDITIDSTSHVFLYGGDFNVSLISEPTNFCYDTMTILVHINRPDVFLIPSDLDQTICEGELVTFEATSGGVIVDFEFFLNGVSLNTPSPNDSIYSTNSLVDQDSISVTVFENGCPTENPASMIFTVLDAPNLTWVSSDADSTICYSDSVAFTASSSDASIQYRYLVNGFVETMYSASGFYWNNTLNDMDTVFVVAQNPNNCRDTLEMPFTVHPLPTTAMVDDVAGSVICANDLITFSTSGAATYEFYVNGVSQFGPSPSSSWSTTSLITGDVVTVMGYSTENCQYMAPESFSYTVNPLPSVGMTISDPDTSICSGTLVNFTSSGASLYELFINGVSQGAAAPISSYNLSTLTDNDTLYFEGTFGSCSNNSDSVIFEVITSPTTTLVSDDLDQTICYQDLVNFTASGANNYEFFVDGISQGPASPSNTFSSATLTNNQTVSVQGESNSCIVTQQLIFTVLPSPSVSLFSDDPDNIICQGDPIVFTSANANTYELFVNTISQGPPQTSATFSPALPSGTIPVYVLGTALNGCTDTSVVVLVTVNPLPNVVVTSSDLNNSICAGEVVTFTGSGSDMYQFFLDGIPQGSMSLTNTLTTGNLSDGQTVNVIGSSLGCTNGSNSITTAVFAVPNVTLTSTDLNNFFCENELIIFTASGANNYEFILDGVSQGPSSPVDVLNSSGFPVGSYAIMAIGESNNCTDTSTLSITVNGLPTAVLVSSDTNNTICSGEIITYSGSGGALYEFFVNGASQGQVSVVDSINLSTLSNGDIVSVTASDANGCSNTAFYPAVTVNPTPIVSLTSTEIDQEICIGDSVIFFGSGSDEYEFFLNGLSQGPSSPVNSLLISSLVDGDIISVIGSSLGCVASGNDLVFTVYNYPTVGLINNGDTSLCTGETTDLIASGGSTYQFLINGTPTGPFGTNANFNGTLSNGDIVTVIGNLNGCENTAPNAIAYSVFTYPILISSVNPGTTICQDEIVSINASGANNYNFELNGSIIQSGTNSVLTISTLENGDTINVIGYNGDCPSTPDVYIFTVQSMILNLSASPSNLICEGEMVTFTATGADQYEFFINGVSQGAMSASNTFNYTAFNDLDEVSFSGYSSSTGCVQNYNDYIVMFFTPQPTITAIPGLVFCEGDSVTLISNAPDGNQWFLDGVIINGATDTAYTIYDSGVYGLEVAQGGNGNVWSFGYNAYGNLGDGTNFNSADPTMAITPEVFDALSAGDYFVLGLTQSGQVFAWGDNEFGQLGDGTYSDASTPQIVPTLTSIKSIATSATSSMAVSITGDLYVWGNNDQGQLATGTTSVINFPFLNTLVTLVDTIAGGRSNFIILKTDGTVWTVGNNDYGQLGDGTLNSTFNAIQVPGLTNIVRIGAGEFHSFAIDNQGDLFVWGNNGSGQLGLNDLINRLSPTQLDLKNVISANGGVTHSMFLTSTKKVFTSGDNTYGQLGTGGLTAEMVPTQIDVLGAVQISAGEYTSLIRRGDNSVFVCGNNNVEQLSSPTGTVVSSPELVP
ncbi:MAG TPA: hypothetical protein EYN51_02290, partial [Flavobacteriales bacterium]|nr:hypothetical protein [Flavobacteriales bacterium]